MQLIRPSPFRELMKAEQEFDKMLDRSWGFVPAFGEISTVDMYTQDGKLVTEVALPDFRKEEIEVKATNEGLEISAEHKEKEEESKNRRYLLRESSRSYWRRLSLPQEAKTDEVKCTIKDGKLTVTMPLKEEATSKKILIE